MCILLFSDVSHICFPNRLFLIQLYPFHLKSCLFLRRNVDTMASNKTYYLSAYMCILFSLLLDDIILIGINCFIVCSDVHWSVSLNGDKAKKRTSAGQLFSEQIPTHSLVRCMTM